MAHQQQDEDEEEETDEEDVEEGQEEQLLLHISAADKICLLLEDFQISSSAACSNKLNILLWHDTLTHTQTHTQTHAHTDTHFHSEGNLESFISATEQQQLGNVFPAWSEVTLDFFLSSTCH